MRTRVRPALVEVYHDGESVNLPSQNLIPYNKAAEAVMEGRGQWRDHGRKLRMFTSWRETDDAKIRDQRGERDVSAKPNVRLMERYSNARSSMSDPRAIVAIECWAGKVKTARDLAGC